MNTRLRYAPFVVPALGVLLFWFVTAPDPRFAGALFWYMAAGSLSVAGARTCSSRKALTVSGLSLMVTILLTLPRSKIIRPGPDGGFYPIPQVQVHTFKTNSGLTLFVPNNGDQCWDAPLPCTPYPNSNLRLRTDGNIAAGVAMSLRDVSLSRIRSD